MRKYLLLLMLSCVPTFSHAATVTFSTEKYPPFQYREGEKILGSSPDQIAIIMKAVGVDYDIEMLPWARAYAQAQSTPMNCVFTTAHTPPRDKLFKWVEPLLVDRNILIKRKGSKVQAHNLEEAKAYVAGTWRDDYSEMLLHNANFPKIDVASDFNTTMKKLMSDRIDVMPISEVYYNSIKDSERNLEEIGVLSEQNLGIACHKDFPDELISKMQTALTNLVNDGQQKAIFAKYGLLRQ